MTEKVYQYQQGYVPNNGNAFYFWVDCSKDTYEEEMAEGGVTRMLYTAAPPAVLPPEMTLRGIKKYINEYTPPSEEEAALFAYNQCRADALALGAQPQPVVELPDSFVIGENADDYFNDVVCLLDDVKIALDAAGVKWEVKK